MKLQTIKKRMAIIEQKAKDAEYDKEWNKRWAVVSNLIRNGGNEPYEVASVKLCDALNHFSEWVSRND